jgi:hypothetical protein
VIVSVYSLCASPLFLYTGLLDESYLKSLKRSLIGARCGCYARFNVNEVTPVIPVKHESVSDYSVLMTTF